MGEKHTQKQQPSRWNGKPNIKYESRKNESIKRERVVLHRTLFNQSKNCLGAKKCELTAMLIGQKKKEEKIIIHVCIMTF